MKSLLLFFLFLFALDGKAQEKDESKNLFISSLAIGDTVAYSVYHTTCLAGDRYHEMETVTFYRDSFQLNALYNNQQYIIHAHQLTKIDLVEKQFYTIENTHKSTYWNYILNYQGKKMLFAYGEKNKWNELISILQRH